jgi:hypothetical protein
MNHVMTRFKIYFKTGNKVDLFADKHTEQDGLHLFFLAPPNLGKFTQADLVEKVEVLPPSSPGLAQPLAVDL